MFIGLFMDLTHPAFTVMNSATVPFKCKLTVSTRNSILDTRCFRESRIEARVSSFKNRVLSFGGSSLPVVSQERSLPPRPD